MLPKIFWLVVGIHEHIAVLVGSHFISERLLVRVQPCTYAHVQKGSKAKQANCRFGHFVVVNWGSFVVICEREPIGYIQDDHAD